MRTEFEGRGVLDLLAVGGLTGLEDRLNPVLSSQEEKGINYVSFVIGGHLRKE